MVDREAGVGLGGNGGGDSGTSPSQITAWLGKKTQHFSETLQYNGLGSTIQITEPSSHLFGR